MKIFSECFRGPQLARGPLFAYPCLKSNAQN